MWGSGFFQCAALPIATIAKPLGPAQLRESNTALSHLAGSGTRAPLAVASTATSVSLGRSAGSELIAPVSPLANWKERMEFCAIAVPLKSNLPSLLNGISEVAP